jgi:hypothetical protein
MILAKSTLNQLTPARVTRRPESAGLANLAASATTCGYHLDHLVMQIESAKVRDIVGTVFWDLLRLLECLRLIETHLRQVDEAKETFTLFQLIHAEASALVKFIREDALPCEVLNEELADTLDGITFAVNHDLQRVFETKPPAATEERPAQVVVGKMLRAHDLLTNCLQQSTISLAIMFDPALEGTRLFDNSDARYRQSVQLCEDLSTLLELVAACGTTREDPAFANLTASVELFRSVSLECLMYSDWPQFESFCEKIQLASTPEFEPVLHQFRCYLETLLGQVRMRAVLANESPIQFGVNATSPWPTADAEGSTQFSASSDLQDENATWDTLPLAV